MSIILDVIFIFLILICIFVGAKKGLFRTLFDFVAYILAFILSAVGSGYFAEPLYNNFFKDSVMTNINQSLSNNIDINNLHQSVKGVLSNIPETIKSYANAIGINLDNLLKETIITNNVTQTNQVGQIIEENIVSPIATSICKVLLFIVFFIVLLCIFRIISYIISKGISFTSITESTDKILGAVFGVLKGVGLTIFFAVLLLFIANLLSEVKPDFHSAISQSYIVQFVDRLVLWVQQI